MRGTRPKPQAARPASTAPAPSKRARHASRLPPPQTYPSIERETRAALPTEEAAYHLSRSPQTLRLWACRQSGPIQPLRINGRLAWPVSEIRDLLGVGASTEVA